MQKITNKITDWLSSPKFFKVVLVLFLIQGVYFVLAVKPSSITIDQASGYEVRSGGVVPDGNRHIGAIYYFAKRPILAGPIVNDQQPADLWIGDLERFPSYLYYYLLSFPVRLSMSLGASDMVNVVLIRLIGLIFGVLGLIIFRRIVKELKVHETVTNMSILALALTGSFVWLTPAENYDILALLFFFLFILSALRLFTRSDSRQLYFMALWLFICSITKYTYLPFMVFLGILATLFHIKSVGRKNLWSNLKNQYKTWLQRSQKAVVALLVVVLVVAGGLFTERIIGNLAKYQAFNPDCAAIHNHEDCMIFGVYSRNYNRSSKVASGEFTAIAYQPIEYTKFWIKRYYSSLYAYVGHVWIPEFWLWMFCGAKLFVAMIAAMFLLLKLCHRRILDNKQQWVIFIAIILLITAQYIINTQSYLRYAGIAYAHQGRYLLAAISFAYILFFLIIYKAVLIFKRHQRKIIVPIIAVIVLFALTTNSAPLVFFKHAKSSEWYNTSILRGKND